jgi:hypothetical protein
VHDPKTHFREAASTFSRVATKYTAALYISHYSFAERTVEIRCVGRTFAESCNRAFAHLNNDKPPHLTPQLSIDLWDENETGIAGPMFHPDSANSWTFNYEDGLFTGTRDGRYMGYVVRGSIAWLDRKKGRIIGWRISGQEIPIYEHSKPLSLLLSVWYNDCGVQIIHAGLVSQQDKGVVFAGPSGSGKTTAALACVNSDFKYLGDDYTGLQKREDYFVGHSLYNSARLEKNHLLRFPQLISHAIYDKESNKEKTLIFIARVSPELVEVKTPIRLVIFPRVSKKKNCAVRPISKGEALLLLAYSSLRIPSRGKKFGLDLLGDLIACTPVFWLDLGNDIHQIARCVSGLLHEVTAP